MTLGLAMRLADVAAIHRAGDVHVLQTESGDVHARTVILATGSQVTPLGVPGEAAFFGRRVSHCATCDGAVFTDHPVAVMRPWMKPSCSPNMPHM
jgi:thioredoxin reductase (NADPH)